MASVSSIEKETEEIIKSGKYPIVQLSLLDSIKNIEVYQSVKDHIEYTMELYQNYLNIIKGLPEKNMVHFLQTLKAAEIIDNQKLEKENSFLLSLCMTVMGNNSIDEMINLGRKNIETKDAIEVHRLLLEGTQSGKKIDCGLRKKNDRFVGSWNNGVRKITYFPLNYTEVDEALTRFLEYYNKDESTEVENIFIKPFISHGLLASLQLFTDGNTRLARLFQHIKLWNLTNDSLKEDLKLPSIYMSRSYYPYRDEYRSKIKDIAINMDNDSWNRWFDFNLNRLEDQLFYIDTNLTEYQKII